MIINLTPHPIRFFPADCPDHINPQDGPPPIHVLYPSSDHPAARIGEISLGTVSRLFAADDVPLIPVEYVEYAAHGGLVTPLPPQQDGVWYVVSLVVAMQQTYLMKNRSDLLVPYREVRNTAGTVIGCRQLARPV